MSGHLLAIDQGTTSTRSLLFDSSGRLRGIAQREFAQSYPQPGWVEHDPLTIWQDVLATARAVIAKSGAPVLPNDGGINGRAARALPNDGRFALIGDPDRGNLLGVQPSVAQSLTRYRQLRLPDFNRVVLDPARPRKILGKLLMTNNDRTAAFVKDDRSRARGTLVEREYVAHVPQP